MHAWQAVEGRPGLSCVGSGSLVGAGLEHDSGPSGVAIVGSLASDPERLSDVVPCPPRTASLDDGRFSSHLQEELEVFRCGEGSKWVTSATFGIGQWKKENLGDGLGIEGRRGGVVGHVVKCT